MMSLGEPLAMIWHDSLLSSLSYQRRKEEQDIEVLILVMRMLMLKKMIVWKSNFKVLETE